MSGWCWIALCRCLMMPAGWSRSVARKLAMERLSRDHTLSAGMRPGSAGGRVEHPQPIGVGVDERPHRRRVVNVQVAPDQHDLPAGQLPVRGLQHARVLGRGEGGAFALAAAVVVQPVDQPGPLTGAVADHPDDPDPPGVVAAAHPHPRPVSPAAPEASLRAA
jgi:hypothetical protein